MQIFEFHFNPPKQNRSGPANKSGRAKQNPDLLFDSFCYEPGNVYEERTGSLFLAGALKNTLPQNIHFLDNLAKLIKDKHYKFNDQAGALKESLKSANEFLDGISKKGDVSWLGNLSFAALALKKLNFNFTKVGDIKIFLLREGEVIDIDKRLKFQDIDPFPLKIFGNIISGKLAENDALLVLTKEIGDFFLARNLLHEIAQIKPFSGNRLREILRSKNIGASGVSGLCLVLLLSNSHLIGQKEIYAAKIMPKVFSLKKSFSSLKRDLQSLILRQKIFRALKNRYAKFRQIIVILNRKIILIAFLIAILMAGFFLSEREKTRAGADYQSALIKIEQKANSALENKDKLMLLETWDNVFSLAKSATAISGELKKRTARLQNIIEENLLAQYKLTEIQSPKLIFSSIPADFIPQKMIADENYIYVFSPYAPNLIKVNPQGDSQILPFAEKFNSANRINGSLTFFAKPDILTVIGNENLIKIKLELPNFDFNFDQIAFFESNLYALDRSTGEILKYPSQGNLEWGKPQLWLKNQTKKPVGSKSIAVDGNVWILGKDNDISRYYFGQLQQSLNLDIFPVSKNFAKVIAPIASPYLYILEPEQSRVIIIDKNGKIVKQFQSKKFDLLLDFSVSGDGKTIYLLNGQKVYEIKISE